MTTPTDNAFEAPKADLSDTNNDKPILEIERFSTWYVLLLSIITLGIYNLYWLYSRSAKINTLAQDKKTNVTALYAYICLFVLYNLMSFFNDPNATSMIAGLLTFAFAIANLVAYVMTVFSMRWSVAEVINKGGEEHVHLGGIMTFFFSSLYFQYKINEAIDKQK